MMASNHAANPFPLDPKASISLLPALSTRGGNAPAMEHALSAAVDYLARRRNQRLAPEFLSADVALGQVPRLLAGEDERADTSARLLAIEGPRMAAPVVAGVVALLPRKRGTLMRDQARLIRPLRRATMFTTVLDGRRPTARKRSMWPQHRLSCDAGPGAKESDSDDDEEGAPASSRQRGI